jgi:drug/metabolite transporter (DMT)-like permease
MVARRVVPRETTLAMVFVGSFVVTVSGLVTAPWGWPPIDRTAVGLLALAACLQGGAHFFIVEAFRYSEAAFISPFRYASVLWATSLGFVLWGDLPDIWIIAGGSLVVCSGLYLLRSKKAG